MSTDTLVELAIDMLIGFFVLLTFAFIIGICIYLIWNSIRTILKPEKEDQLHYYKHLRLDLFILGAIFVFIVYCASIGISSIHPILGRNIFGIIFFIFNGETETADASKWVYFVFSAVFVALIPQLPKLAHSEEIQFRKGTNNWPHGIVRSIKFGLIHMTSFYVPLSIALALSIPGLYFTQKYFSGGVDESTKAHLHYNIMAVLFIVGYTILKFI